MHARDVGRWMSMVALVGATVLTAVSCGGSGSTSIGGGFDASVDDGSGSFQLDPDAAVTNNCTPKTCAQLGFSCGPNADGCGGVIQCGSCPTGEYCGGGGFSVCGNPSFTADGGSPCTPKSCADVNADCGKTADGCGGILDCGPTTCPGTEYCGGGGPSKCGGNYLVAQDGGAACTPKTCTDLGNPCGIGGDGCGGVTGVCSTCTSPQYCGGGGPSKCGGNNGRNPDGGVIATCVPKTCADLGTPCGASGDGCGGMTPVCSTCSSPQFCGGGGFGQCGGNNGLNPDGGIQCTPKTCANFPGTCGQQSDGCGGLTQNCGSCTSPQYCGGGGVSKCGGSVFTGADGGVVSTCTPKTCATLGYSCGAAGDGCGGKIASCGPACPSPSSCGGGGTPGQCGTAQACTGLCAQQIKCDAGTTTISGTVRSGLQESTNGSKWVPSGTTPDPVPGVLVYVPTTTVLPFDNDPTQPQVQCNQCGADVSGTPLVQTTTDFKGNFILSNVPFGNSIPIVIQLGRWRRQFTVNVTTKCGDNKASASGTLNLPSNSTEGDIPFTAISTGSYDSIECVLLKMGVAQDEFMSYATWNGEAVPTGSKAPRKGRVHIYTGTTAAESVSRGPGATIASGLGETALLGSGAANTAGPNNGNYMKYDQILLPCWGDEFTAAKSGAELKNLGYYGDHGGHFFATHYSYSWLNTNANSSLSSVANWNPGRNTNVPQNTPFTGSVKNTVPTSNPGLFLNWLNYVSALNASNPGGAPPANPTVTIDQGRHDVDSVVAGKSVDWIDGQDPAHNSEAMLLHFTFDMPVSQSGQCGHAIYSDFHVNGSTSNGQTFPNECDSTALTPQEKILEYMIWDLASCVPGPPTTVCTPTKTCANQNIGCGFTDDGCGNLLTCATCAPGTTCGGGGVANQCGAPDAGACTPATCASLNFHCGQTGDGCGGLTANCGSCATGQSCGGGGAAGQCGSPPGNGCTPTACTTGCGFADDGCGNLVTCPACPAGQTCGGGGVANQCGTPPTTTCTPLSCQDQQISCGAAANGCGAVIASCGTCVPPQSCGGGGVSGQCGGTIACTPQTCAQQGLECGPAGDGCGNLLPNGCGTCPGNQTCGGGGVAGKCGGGGTCTPKTCQDLNTNCGPAGDGCGGLIPSCGSCSPPDTCGGGGNPGKCGSNISK